MPQAICPESPSMMIISQVRGATYTGMVDYGADLEAYAFSRPDYRLHVVWVKEDKTVEISIPQDELLAVYDRGGVPFMPPLVDGSYRISAGFETIYIHLRP